MIPESDPRTETVMLDTLIRGRIISQFNYLDNMIGEIITLHYSKDEVRRNQLFVDIINSHEFSFSRKTRLFFKMLKKYYPDLHNRNKKLKKELQDIGEYRNKITHYIAAVNNEIMEKGTRDRVMLINNTKDHSDPLYLTIDERDEKIFEIYNLIKEIIKIGDEIEPPDRDENL